MANSTNDIKPESLEYRMPFTVDTARADMNMNLRLGSIVDLFVHSAFLSADSLHFGFDDLEGQDLFWVLRQLTVEIEEPMKWKEHGQITTWPKDQHRIMYLRDFILYNEENNPKARSSSSWLVIDKHSKRPKVLKNDMLEVFTQLKDQHALPNPPEKLFPVNEGEISELKTTYFDIDLNKHVTSSRYVDWMMDTFSAEFHANNYPKSFSINFLKETMVDEKIQIRKLKTDNNTYLFEGYNLNRDMSAFLGKIVFLKRKN
ncbi:MAG: hypothetical protein JXR53_14565 [Bacteroidales bacterium]|nr:hypothetical protein [Bacteroidales bacterium]